MPNTIPLFSCRYLPISWCLSMGCIAIILSLLKFTQTEFSNLLSLQDWLLVLFTQPLHGWLITIFVGIITIFVACTKLIITSESITIEAFCIIFSTLADKQKVEKLQLYSHAKSKRWIFKSIIPHKTQTLEDEWEISTLAFVLKPAYRSTYALKNLWLGQLSTADRLRLIKVLQQHWLLKPHVILGIDQLSQQMRRHKLR